MVNKKEEYECEYCKEKFRLFSTKYHHFCEELNYCYGNYKKKENQQ